MIFRVSLAALRAAESAYPVPVLTELAAFRIACLAIHELRLQQAVAVVNNYFSCN